MKILFLAISLMLQVCKIEAAEAENAGPNGSFLVSTIKFAELDPETCIELPKSGVQNGVPLFALRGDAEQLSIYNICLPENVLTAIRDSNTKAMESSKTPLKTLSGTTVLNYTNKPNEPFESLIKNGEEYRGRNWLISGESAIVGADSGLNVCTTFFDGITELTLQACTPGLTCKAYSFNMQPFAPGVYSSFPEGGSFFSGIVNFYEPNHTTPH